MPAVAIHFFIYHWIVFMPRIMRSSFTNGVQDRIINFYLCNPGNLPDVETPGENLSPRAALNA